MNPEQASSVPAARHARGIECARDGAAGGAAIGSWT